jgi:CheY-like chemotaxis protein
MLGIFSIKPDLALSGIEAIQMARKKSYDLIFMDHMMPEMDGLETTKLIRLIGGACATVPIVALTANVVGDMEEMFLSNHFDAYLPKPLDFATLNLCLRKWLSPDLISEAEAETETDSAGQEEPSGTLL